ncbi:PepSY-associated TM helix domain-containing protein [Chachezhania sediminis]|uniref:PepSY-associated TM helix domain-containing protein n=1 Tax=Chachezhania sediminis TaxID=2599291 RepID=UPI00131E47FF|nr:PepSY-associated TM helix domain-containing protein [Chachezhania sediminis]
MFRKLLFWSHLVAGFTAGIFILILSATGVLLTYESQIVDGVVTRALASDRPLTTDALVAAVIDGGAAPGQTLTLPRDPGDPAYLSAGRGSTAVDPATGALAPEAGAAARAFFVGVEHLHRYLSTTGSTKIGSALVDASNLIFLFIVLSGLYLWLPPVFRWTRIRMQLFFRRGLPSAQARDYNWHHVFGIWALVPLFLIVLSGVVISYPWASALSFALVGEQAPVGRPRPSSDGGLPKGLAGATLDGAAVDWSALLAAGAAGAPDWRRAALVLPADGDRYVSLVMDSGNGVQAGLQHKLIMDRATGGIAAEASGSATSRGMTLRRWFRFVHTGQVYGILGQTVAGLTSLAALVLVYTGLALGVRRLKRMFGRKRPARS